MTTARSRSPTPREPAASAPTRCATTSAPGCSIPIDRAASGHRRYAEEDLVRIQFLTKLRSTGMPIRQIRAYADLMRRGDETHEARLALLEEHREAVRAQSRRDGAQPRADRLQDRLLPRKAGSTMKQRNLGSLDRPRNGPRLHGHVRVLRHDRRGRGARHDRSRPRAGLQLPRHGGDVRPVQERGARGQGDLGPPRRLGDRDQVRHPLRAHEGRPHQPRAGRLGRERAPRDRGLAEAARDRPRRPLVSAPRRLQPADRGDRRRDGASWCRRARCATSASARRRPRRSGAHMRRTRSPRCRRSTRCGRATSRRRSCRHAASSASGSSPTRRSAAASSRAASSRRTTSTRTTSAATGPRFQGEALEQNLQPGGEGRGAGAGEGLHAGPAGARLGARAGRGRGADPRDEAAHVPGGEPGRRGRRADSRTTSSASAPRCRRPRATATTASG